MSDDGEGLVLLFTDSCFRMREIMSLNSSIMQKRITTKTKFLHLMIPKNLMNKSSGSKLPEGEPEEVSNRIASFFTDKVAKIRDGLEQIQHDYSLQPDPEVCLVKEGEYLTCFDDTTEAEVRKIFSPPLLKHAVLTPYRPSCSNKVLMCSYQLSQG